MKLVLNPTLSSLSGIELSAIISLAALLVLFLLLVYIYRQFCNWKKDSTFSPFRKLRKSFSFSGEGWEEPDIVFADPTTIREDSRRSSRYGIGEAIGIANLNSKYEVPNLSEVSTLLMQTSEPDGAYIHKNHTTYNTYQHPQENGIKSNKLDENGKLSVNKIKPVQGQGRRGSTRSLGTTESNLSLD
mmetsp:Transcript_696/g.844  ORF Transcript_696/g.844 Transcript_696/m.844 type:complete len:187 (+) Transcript_696:131-691(+)